MVASIFVEGKEWFINEKIIKIDGKEIDIDGEELCMTLDEKLDMEDLCESGGVEELRGIRGVEKLYMRLSEIYYELLEKCVKGGNMEMLDYMLRIEDEKIEAEEDEMCKLLRKALRIEKKSKSSSLRKAAKKGNREMVEKLLEKIGRAHV